MVNNNSNNWMKYWPLMILVGSIIGSYAVLREGVKSNTQLAKANELCIRSIEKNQVENNKDIGYIIERLETMKKDQDKNWEAQRAVNTQVIEFLRTVP